MGHIAKPSRVTLGINVPARADGYRPITETLVSWGAMSVHLRGAGVPYILGAARRLDAAHRLVEYARKALDHAESLTPGTPPWRTALYEAIGDSEMAVVALHRVVEMAASLNASVGVSVALVPFPRSLRAKMQALRELRDAYEHLDNRALGKSRRPGIDPMEAFSFQSLAEHRFLRYGPHQLDLGRETTTLIQEVASYLTESWMQLCTAAQWGYLEPKPLRSGRT